MTDTNATNGANHDWMRKIGALLAKAEKTDSPEEANTFFEGAQRLMLEMAISEAEARAAFAGASAKETPVVDKYWEFATNIHGSSGKMRILSAAASANNVRILTYSNTSGMWKGRFPGTNAASQRCTLVGYQADIDRTKVLYASLLIQATRASKPAWKTYQNRTEYDEFFRPVKKVSISGFLNSFFTGFAHTIQVRFWTQKEGLEKENPTGMALITLVGKEVDDALAAAFPNLKQGRSSRVNSSGYYQGRHAGQTANLEVHAGHLKKGN